MPGIRRFLSMGLVASLFFVTGLNVHSCPFCPPTDPTLSEKLAESDAACLVKFLSSEDGEELSMQKTRFQVLRLMKPSADFKVDSQIEIPIGVTAKEGDVYLLFGQKKEGEMEWSLPDEMNDETIAYVEQAPPPEARSKSERLVYFFNCLGNSNPKISNDAFGEFARAELIEVERMIEQLPEQSDRKTSRANARAKLRKWLNDPSPTLDVRRGFYGMLLGMCGTDDDASLLETMIMSPIAPDKNRFWIEGVLAGYFMLRGEPGLKLIVEKKLDSLPKVVPISDPRLTDINALRGTLSFLWDNRRPQFSDESLRAVMRRFLDRPEFADLVVPNLARWKDWSSLDRLIAAYGREPWETRSAKEKIVAFALSCRKDVPANALDNLPEHAAKAQAFLDSLDPDFVKSVKLGTGGLVPPLKTPPKADSSND